VGTMLEVAGILGQTPSSTGQTIALLLTFLGIGVIANVIIIYAVASVIAERKENQERRQRDV
jgi:phage shock protein PspC (stress-responsive transcriptional regulator)